jgi:hypothetical protein
MITKKQYREYKDKLDGKRDKSKSLCIRCFEFINSDRDEFYILSHHKNAQGREDVYVSFCLKCWHIMAGTCVDIEES